MIWTLNNTRAAPCTFLEDQMLKKRLPTQWTFSYSARQRLSPQVVNLDISTCLSIQKTALITGRTTNKDQPNAVLATASSSALHL